MNEAEIEVWSRQAATAAVAAVDDYARLTRNAWRKRLHGSQELFDLVSYAPDTGMINVEHLARAAAVASIELCIICYIYPRPIDAALRPAWQD